MLNLLGVIVAFIVIIILIRKKINFGLSLLIGSVIVGVFSLTIIEIWDILKAFIQASIYSFEDEAFTFETIELAILMTLIYILAKSMQDTGAITKLIDSLRSFFSKGGTLGVIPAVYGLMPVPGGALFSAPLINNEGEKFGLNANQKNFLNVWFRHIWFPIYPISSAMILLCSVEFANINIYHLILADLPAFLAFTVIGLIMLRLFIRKTTPNENKRKKEFKGLRFLLPPTIPIILYAVLFAIGLPDIQLYQKTIFLIGVIISLIFLYVLLDLKWKEYLQIIKKSISFNLALAIFGIMIFREMVFVSQADIRITSIMTDSAIPGILIVILVPMLLGLLLGYNLGAIGLSYPLVSPFFSYIDINIIGLASIIFMSSLVGYLISPIHLCNVLSSDYLKTDTTRMYKMYLPAISILLIVHLAIIITFYSLS